MLGPCPGLVMRLFSVLTAVMGPGLGPLLTCPKGLTAARPPFSVCELEQGLLGRTWGSWGLLTDSLGLLEGSWVLLGASWTLLEASWAPLGPS